MKEKLYSIPQERTFTMLIGLPGTGKSTFAKKLLQHNSEERKLVSSDSIRFDLLNYDETGIDFDPKIEPKVWEIIDGKLRKVLSDPTVNEVIFDTTNLNKSRRKKYLDLAKEAGFNTRGIVFSVSLDEVKKRNRNRTREVPEEVIERFHKTFDFPEEEEFDELYEIES
jgi:predicted kinase